MSQLFCSEGDFGDEIISTNFVNRDPANPGVQGTEDLKQLVNMYRTAFPDARFNVLRIKLLRGIRMVTRWTARGTHLAEFQGIAPTGQQMAITGSTIDRMVGGKIEESWSNWGSIGMMQQLGVIPKPT